MKQISLTRGEFALVDDEDFEIVNRYKWSIMTMHGNKYARGHGPMINGKRDSLLMHRVIMNAEHGQEIDHRDNNGLNNQKSNLRFCTRTQNNANRCVIRAKSGVKGVRFVPKARFRPWNARIVVNYNLINLGYFRTLESAALAYNNAAVLLFGTFSKANNV